MAFVPAGRNTNITNNHRVFILCMNDGIVSERRWSCELGGSDESLVCTFFQAVRAQQRRNRPHITEVHLPSFIHTVPIQQVLNIHGREPTVDNLRARCAAQAPP